MSRHFYGTWARYLVIFTLLVGVGFHSVRLVIGVEAFQVIFTPMVDAIFSIPIILAIVAMFRGWPVFDFRGRVEKAIVMFTVAYFIVSMPLHFQTWFTQDTSYIMRFPWWYSLVFISYTSVLAWVWARLKIRVTAA